MEANSYHFILFAPLYHSYFKLIASSLLAAAVLDCQQKLVKHRIWHGVS